MSRIEAFCVKVLSYCGVDPTAGDLAGGVRRWPETRPAATEPVPPAPALGSPYECTPTAWGVEEAAAPEPRAEDPPAPASVTETRKTPRRRRRFDLELKPQPVPRGLLLR